MDCLPWIINSPNECDVDGVKPQEQGQRGEEDDASRGQETVLNSHGQPDRIRIELQRRDFFDNVR